MLGQSQPVTGARSGGSNEEWVQFKSCDFVSPHEFDMRNTIIIVDVTVMACVMCLQTVIASHPTEGSFKFAADRTVNHELHAVPVPGPVAIDGDLVEWDVRRYFVL